MKKIIVIGSPGAGKSTFARRLSVRSGLPLYHLDLLWHRPDRTTISRDEFDAQLAGILQRDRWIIDGTYLRTLALRLGACDTVFLLDFPLETCLSGAASRIGTRRDDMPWAETEFDPEFRTWIMEFPHTQLPQIYALLERETAKNVVVFYSREEAEDYLRRAAAR